MICKRFIADVETESTQVFDCERCHCTGIHLTESVNMSNLRNKLCSVNDSIVDVQILIAKILLLHEIVIERFSYTVSINTIKIECPHFNFAITIPFCP